MLRAVATDGHRLAQAELEAPAGSQGLPGVIVPRKTVAEIQKLLEDKEAEVTISLSATKIRVQVGAIVLTSKLIDGTFPDYGRVIPQGNDKTLIVDKDEFAAAVDRVSTVSSERGRAVKLSLGDGKMVLSVTNPDSGSATEELEVDYTAEPLDIGFNSRYPAGHHLPARRRHGRAEARRSRLAHPGARFHQDGCALRPHAHRAFEITRLGPAGVRRTACPAAGPAVLTPRRS